MRKILILLLLTTLIACNRKSEKPTIHNSLPIPEYYETKINPEYPDDRYITGIGESDTREKAIDLSKKEISGKISSSLKSTFSHQKRAYRKNSKLIYNKQTIESNLEVSTSLERANFAKNINVYYDSKKNKYLAFSALDRDDYSKILEPKLEDLKRNFANEYNLALEALKKIDFERFAKIYPKMINLSNEFNNKLMEYSVVINNLDYYKEENLLENLTKINNTYQKVAQIAWIVTATGKKRPKIKNPKKGWSWETKENGIGIESEYFTKVLFNTLKDEGINVNKLDRSVMKFDILNQKTLNQLANLGQGKLVLWGDINFKCSSDKYMFYCRSTIDISGKLLSGEEIISFTVGTLNRHTKKEREKYGITEKIIRGNGVTLKIAYEKSLENLKTSLIERLKKDFKKYKVVK